MITATYLTFFACIALGAALYRWRGHGKVSGPRWLKLFMMAAFLCLPLLVREEGALAGVALPVAFFFLSRAHGEHMDLAHVYGWGREEQDWPGLPWLLGWIKSRYWYEFFALAITGLAATLGPGIALALAGDLWGGIALAVAGILKAPAYAIGWAVWRRDGNRATECGEWLTGALWGSVVGLVL